MSPTETVTLVALMANGWPAMRLEPGTADVWHGALVDVEFDDAREAVTSLLATARWPALSDIIEVAREIRSQRRRAELDRREHAQLEARIAQDPELRQRLNSSDIAESWAAAHGLPEKRPRPAELAPAGYELRVAALRIACPFCHAKPGEMCRNDATGRQLRAGVHPSRSDAAQDDRTETAA